MNFEHTQKTKDLIVQVSNFIDQKIKPKEAEYTQAMDSFRESGNPWQVPEVLTELKSEAKAEGLWNFSLTGDEGYGLTNLEFAPLAEMMGVGWTSEVFNSSAPDAGNMEVLDKYGSDYQKERWLKPLLNGEIRSAFAMTEPNVASSDATNISRLLKNKSQIKDKKNTLIVLAWNFYKDIKKNNSSLSENFINIKDLESNN